MQENQPTPAGQPVQAVPQAGKVPVVKPVRILRTEHADGSVDVTVQVPALKMKNRGKQTSEGR